jgi:hypothetical protein
MLRLAPVSAKMEAVGSSGRNVELSDRRILRCESSGLAILAALVVLRECTPETSTKNSW